MPNGRKYKVRESCEMATKASKAKKAASGREKELSTDPVLRVVATNKLYGKWCRESLKHIPASDRKRLDLLAFDNWNDVKLARPIGSQKIQTVFVSRLGDIPDSIPADAQAGPTGKHLLFAEDMPVEAIPSRVVRLGVRNAERIHIAREHTPSTISGLLCRVIMGMVQQDGPHRIADAWIEHEQLVLLAPSFVRIVIPLAKLQKFVGDKIEDVANFHIDEDGSFLYWPHADVHMGWDQFQTLIDPAAAFIAKLKTSDFTRRYGEAIRSFRESRGLRQADVAGLTERHLRRVEKGEIMASKSTLEALATAHHLPLNAYLKELARLSKQ